MCRDGVYLRGHLEQSHLCMVQKDSEITFKAERPAGDPNKLADYERAMLELKAAHQLFLQLSHLDRRHNPIDIKKLQTHQQYCEQAFRQSQVAIATPHKLQLCQQYCVTPYIVCKATCMVEPVLIFCCTLHHWHICMCWTLIHILQS